MQETKVACDHSVLVGVADWECVTEVEYQAMVQDQQIGAFDVFLSVFYGVIIFTILVCIVVGIFGGRRGKIR